MLWTHCGLFKLKDLIRMSFCTILPWFMSIKKAYLFLQLFLNYDEYVIKCSLCPFRMNWGFEKNLKANYEVPDSSKKTNETHSGYEFRSFFCKNQRHHNLLSRFTDLKNPVIIYMVKTWTAFCKWICFNL